MIKYLRNIIKLLLEKNNVSYYKNIEKKKILDVINLFKPYKAGYNLIRVGDNNDGGYLLPDCLDDIKYCFSAGVGDKTSFENDLKKIGIHPFLADFSVDDNGEIKKFDFDKKFIKSYNSDNAWDINDWMDKKIDDQNKKNLLLQMDIEGGEYEVISAINENNLKAFKMLVVEFHSIEYLGNHLLYQILESSLTKLLKYFGVVHIHPNNWKKLSRVNGLNLPSNLEVTFLNKKFIKKWENIDKLPHSLDKKNLKDKPDIQLDEYWYR